MSADETAAFGGPGAGPGAGQPSEEEMRAAYEAELSRITTTDMIAQSAVSLLNLGARRLAPPAPGEEQAAAQGGGRDLAQVRDAIDAARALLEILERTIPQELRPLRDALSQLQMAYAREVQMTGAPVATPPGPAGEAPGGAPAPAQEGSGAEGPPPAAGGPGPAQASGRLWVPGS